jgi:DNA polymerase
MTLSNPCIKSVGPRDAKVVLIGEAPGKDEELTGIPFVGASGQELNRMLHQAGLKRSEILLTNVIFTRPPENKFDAFTLKKTDLPPAYDLPALSSGQYLHPDFRVELERLWGELLSVKPNLIIAAGATAAWSVLGSCKISQIRGTLHQSRFGKVLPTWHPAVLFHGQWDLRAIIVADLMKAFVEKDFPEIRRPERYVLIDPTIEEVEEWCAAALAAPLIACDVETRGGGIACLGLASSPSDALVVPFFDPRKLAFDPVRGLSPGSYWTRHGEVRARQAIQSVLGSSVPKLFQNGLYDIQYLLREGFRPRHCNEDTMILHHALYPEMPKALGFLGSLYTNEAAWKMLRHGEDKDD